MVVLPPGTLLQLMYLQERLRHIPPGKFIEIGPGNGEITGLLLENGWTGVSYDLDYCTVSGLKKRFEKEISNQHFFAINSNFMASPPAKEKVDLVISCMVMEHLNEDEQRAYLQTATKSLKEDGMMIGLVPASPEHWGIEDDIAGHFRRYTKTSLESLAAHNNWRLLHIAGLTFPISNFLLPVSNYLVNKNERSKLALSALERTKHSGRRQVKFKTHFPSILGLFLNKFAMYPLHIIQKFFSKSDRALVLYFEAKPCAEKNNQ